MPALRLTASPRQSESDAGSLLLRLVFESYVQRLGWRVPLTVLEAKWNGGAKVQATSAGACGEVDAMDTTTAETAQP